MKTEIFDFKEEIDLEKLKEISNYIKEGQLVAIPTETVYGLAADGLNPVAIKKIFDVKNRPMDNPLILHISNIDEIYKLTKNVSDKNIEILKKIWPGPLTVVLEKSEIIPNEVTAGLNSVAIRLPQKEITRKFIEFSQTPLAAPSANLSTKPSPTNVNDVYEDLKNKIPAIIDAGQSEIGIESTVLDLTEEIPKILRPGFYTKEMLEKYWNKVDLDTSIINLNSKPKSPGQKYKHYAPKAKVIVIVADDEKFLDELDEILKNTDETVGIMAFEDDLRKIDIENKISIGKKEDLSYMGKVLFKSFRQLDSIGVDLIIVRGVVEEGYGLSIMNRLKKSASNNIIIK